MGFCGSTGGFFLSETFGCFLTLALLSLVGRGREEEEEEGKEGASMARFLGLGCLPLPCTAATPTPDPSPGALPEGPGGWGEEYYTITRCIV